jgi:hypothetical protein
MGNRRLTAGIMSRTALFRALCVKGGTHPKLSSVTKLSGKDDLIREYLDRKIPVSVIARLLNVNRLTVRHYLRTRKLQKPAS